MRRELGFKSLMKLRIIFGGIEFIGDRNNGYGEGGV